MVWTRYVTLLFTLMVAMTVVRSLCFVWLNRIRLLIFGMSLLFSMPSTCASFGLVAIACSRDALIALLLDSS